MIKLTIKAKDVNELILFWEKLGELIREGYISGTLLDGWDLSEVKDE